MTKLLFPLGIVALLTMVLSVFSNLLPSTSEVNVVHSVEDISSKEDDTFNWKEVLVAIPTYYKQPEDTNKAKVTKPKPKPKPKRRPTEAKLVAVVNLDVKDEAIGMFLMPRSTEPKALKIGEGWLEPWTIKELNADYVIWINAEDSNEIKQALF